MIRLGLQPWGPLPSVTEFPRPDPEKSVHVVLEGWTGKISGKRLDSEIRELRWLPADGSDHFAWEAFPALVAEISAWIGRQAAGLKGRTFLLGTVLPPEVALGLGIDAGRANRHDWPEHLWPIVYNAGGRNLVIPGLDLGTSALTIRGDR